MTSRTAQRRSSSPAQVVEPALGGFSVGPAELRLIRQALEGYELVAIGMGATREAAAARLLLKKIRGVTP